MASDSGLFRTRAELEAAGWKLDGNHFVLDKQRALPLMEAKMVHHFDHRFATYENATQANLNKGTLPRFGDADHAHPRRHNLPEYWVAESEVEARLEGHWRHEWLLGWRRICRSVDERTLIASLFPVSGVGDSEFLLLPSLEPRLASCMYGNLCSLSLDYAARQKVGGANASFHIVRQLPVLAPSVYAADALWSHGTTLRDWILSRVLELTFTAWDLQPFARDVGDEGSPYIWDSERRFTLRCELDAAFFHLYGVSRDDADYIMGTFPVVEKNDEKALKNAGYDAREVVRCRQW
jgi:hypothetical protein